MIEVNWLLFAGCLLVIAAFVCLVARHETALFGLSLLNAFIVGSATLSGFFLNGLLGQSPTIFTPEHAQVIGYSILGLLAMAAGIHIAWTPSRFGNVRRDSDRFRVAHHINEGAAWLTFGVGASAELLEGFVRGLPTLSTAVHCGTTLSKIGLCMLLIVAIRTRRWNRFLVGLGCYEIISVVSSLSSGFSFLRLRTIFPLIAIWLVARGLTVNNVLKMVIATPPITLALFSASSAWFATRDMIRRGLLEGLPLIEKAGTFFDEYLASTQPSDR